MEVIRRSKQGFRFKVLKSFLWAGRNIQIGESIEDMPEPNATMLVINRKIEPILPEVSTYVCLKAIVLPGKVTKFEAGRMQRVEIRREDAFKLLLDGSVIPEDPNAWRPMNRRLRGGPDLSRQKQAALAKADLDQKLWEIGIRPKK